MANLTLDSDAKKKVRGFLSNRAEVSSSSTTSIREIHGMRDQVRYYTANNRGRLTWIGELFGPKLTIENVETKLSADALAVASLKAKDFLANAEAPTAKYDSLAAIDAAVSEIDEMLGIAGKSRRDLSGKFESMFSPRECPITRKINNARAEMALKLVDKQLTDIKADYARTGSATGLDAKIVELNKTLDYPNGRSQYSKDSQAKRKQVNVAIKDIFIDALECETEKSASHVHKTTGDSIEHISDSKKLEVILDKLEDKRYTSVLKGDDKKVIDSAKSAIRDNSRQVINEELAKLKHSSHIPDITRIKQAIKSWEKAGKGAMFSQERAEFKTSVADLQRLVKGKKLEGNYSEYKGPSRAQRSAASSAQPGLMDEARRHTSNAIGHAKSGITKGANMTAEVLGAVKDQAKTLGSIVAKNTIDMVQGAGRDLAAKISRS